MTFDNTAWAIDGATTRSALARTAEYAAMSGAQGIVQSPDLKVTQLAVPGNGLLIAAGSAIVLNGYQGSGTDQAYVASNPESHTVASGDMPASSGSAQSYILALVIGDPEFAQTGHPFMGPLDPPSGEEATFEYVRPVMISVAAGATTLGAVTYPNLPLARIDIPASTLTITNAMITDLRNLARPRRQLEIGQGLGDGTAHNLPNGSWQRVPNSGCLTVVIPTWATKAKIMGFVEGLRLHAAGNGKIQVYIESNSRSGETTNVNENAPGGSDDRRSYNVGAVLDVSDLRGTTQTFSVRGQGNSAGDVGFLKTDANTSAMLSVQFEEKPV
jgi:hypothetical protein